MSDGNRPAAAAPARVERLAADLLARGEPFVRATVVRREPPVSANVGDSAVVTADGDLVGWIGGAACAQSVVRREARAALASGDPALVGLAPDPETVDRPGLDAYPMSCHSEGVLEIFLAPVVPAPRLLVVGRSPVARELVELAHGRGFDVAVVDPDDGDHPGETIPTTGADAVVDAAERAPFVVVASMGAYDAAGLEAGLRLDAGYVGLVASDERAADLYERVADRLGTDPASVREAVTNPAGVDVAARSPGEIAVSILAELVDVRNRQGVDATAAAGGPASQDADDAETGDGDEGGETGDGSDDGTVVDPVCGMAVDPAEAAATVDHDGETYHFCGDGCASAFADAPTEYLQP